MAYLDAQGLGYYHKIVSRLISDATDGVREDIDQVTQEVADLNNSVGDMKDTLEKSISDLGNLKSDRNEVTAIAAETDRQRVAIDEVKSAIDEVKSDASEIRDDIKDANIKIATKAESNEVTAIAAEADRQRIAIDEVKSDVSEIRDDIKDANMRIATKAEAIDVQAVNVDVEKVEASIRELKDVIEMKAGINELAATAADVMNAYAAIEDVKKASVSAGQVASIFTEFENMSSRIQSTASSLETQQLQIAAVNTELSGKISKPSTDGTSGQVLSSNGDGTSSWANPFQPSDEQMGEIISDWLDEHPEATTTVADGSITVDKLSEGVRKTIEDNTGTFDNSVCLDMQATIRGASDDINPGTKRHVDQFNSIKDKLLPYAALYDDNDGFGFVFFTDPHNANSFYGESHYGMLEGLRLVRTAFENSPAQYVVCGGDWLNYAHTREEAVFLTGRIRNLCRSKIGDKCYNVIGNHDNNSAGQQSQDHVPETTLHRLWFDSDIAYYKIDSDRTTGFMFDSGDENAGQTTYRLSQAQWFAECLTSNAKPHMFGFIHILHSPTYIETNATDWLGDKLTAIATAFNKRESITVGSQNYNFASAVGTFHFMCCGHYHTDGLFTRNNIPVARTDGFLHGHNFDMCYANFDTAKLHMIRIGSGNNRTMNIIPNGGWKAASAT